MMNRFKKDTWYWASHPHEGDIWIPLYCTGTQFTHNDNNYDIDKVKGMNIVEATMPDSGTTIEWRNDIPKDGVMCKVWQRSKNISLNRRIFEYKQGRFYTVNSRSIGWRNAIPIEELEDGKR